MRAEANIQKSQTHRVLPGMLEIPSAFQTRSSLSDNTSKKIVDVPRQGLLQEGEIVLEQDIKMRGIRNN